MDLKYLYYCERHLYSKSCYNKIYNYSSHVSTFAAWYVGQTVEVSLKEIILAVLPELYYSKINSAKITGIEPCVYSQHYPFFHLKKQNSASNSSAQNDVVCVARTCFTNNKSPNCHKQWEHYSKCNGLLKSMNKLTQYEPAKQTFLSCFGFI